MVLGPLFLLFVLGSSSILLPVLFVIAPPRLLRLVSIHCHCVRFTVGGFDSLSLVLIRCHSFRFTAVGLDSASLVSSRPGWFLRRLAPPSPCHLSSLSSCRLAPPSPSHLALPLLLVVVLFPFLFVVLSSRLRRCVVSHPCHPSSGRPSSLLLRGLIWSWWQGQSRQ